MSRKNAFFPEEMRKKSPYKECNRSGSHPGAHLGAPAQAGAAVLLGFEAKEPPRLSPCPGVETIF